MSNIDKIHKNFYKQFFIFVSIICLIFLILSFILLFLYTKENNEKTKVSQQFLQEIKQIKQIKTPNFIQTTNSQNLSVSKNEEFPIQNYDECMGFNDLIGCQNEKEAVQDFLKFIKNPSDFQGIGDIKTPTGLIMYGVGGTGKTIFARALGKESKLPMFEISSATFSQKYYGESPQKVMRLFKIAREKAEEYGGAIIFIDECETVFTKSFNDSAHSNEIRNIVNQFKAELTSRSNKKDKPIFIIGATNNYNQIDDAMKSRFSFKFEFKVFDKKDRQKYLETRIEKRRNPYSEEAKQYLFNVVNEVLERVSEPPQKDDRYLKANRTLESILDSVVLSFANERTFKNDKGENIKRNLIEVIDVKKAFKKIVSGYDKDFTDLDEKWQQKNKK